MYMPGTSGYEKTKTALHEDGGQVTGIAHPA
jgi:hypothetical protein